MSRNGQSFPGHALAAAGALESIRVLHEENLPEKTRELGDYLGSDYMGSKSPPCVGDVRGLGLFWTLELIANRETLEALRKHTEKYKKPS